MTPVHIWIDGDSCPHIVRQHVYQTAARRALPVTVVANAPLPEAGPDCLFEMIVTEQTPDAADNYISARVHPGDLVITHDIPFAARLIAHGVSVINNRGSEFTKDTIEQKLRDRAYDLSLAAIGFTGRKQKQYGKKEFAQFAPCFERVLNRVVRERQCYADGSSAARSG
ncbi:MAG: DUF188 domain-containing protein [Treponema sp.]|nr:DUF188 domain-containing protein [Treponema sp.]